MKTRILIVDQDAGFRTSAKARFEQEGYQVTVAESYEDAVKKNREEFAVLLAYFGPAGSGKRDGLALFQEFSKQYPNLKSILVTDSVKKEDVVRALRAGVSDCFEKPVGLDELCKSVERCLKQSSSSYQKRDSGSSPVSLYEARLQKSEGKIEDHVWYVSKSNSMAKVNESLSSLRREVMRGGTKEPSVLLLGENGAGHEGVARMIHAGSHRGKGPWGRVNCAQADAKQLEVELFGQEVALPGGGTSISYGALELAGGGTLLLEDVGALGSELQNRLLKALQNKVFSRVGADSVGLELDVRVIATHMATHNSDQSELKGALFQLLSQVVIEVPALRDRKEDILPMASQFAEQSFRNLGKKFRGFSSDAQQALADYPWPGNVRELYHVMERVALICENEGMISAQTLGLSGSAISNGGAPKLHLVPTTNSLQESMDTDMSYTDLKKRWSDSFEREYLVSTLNRHGGNVSAAARQSKLDRSNFLRLLRRHGLRAEQYRKAA